MKDKLRSEFLKKLDNILYDFFAKNTEYIDTALENKYCAVLKRFDYNSNESDFVLVANDNIDKVHKQVFNSVVNSNSSENFYSMECIFFERNLLMSSGIGCFITEMLKKEIKREFFAAISESKKEMF